MADRPASPRSVSCSRRGGAHRGHAPRTPAYPRSPPAASQGRSAGELLLLAQLCGDARPLQRRQVIDEDLAAQMVHFVLDTHRKQSVGVEVEAFAALVLRAHADTLGTGDLVVVAGNRQAAFLVFGLAG